MALQRLEFLHFERAAAAFLRILRWAAAVNGFSDA